MKEQDREGSTDSVIAQERISNENCQADWNQDCCGKNAEAFFQTACLIEMSKPEFLCEMAVSYAVNLSFSCELWMKYILHFFNVNHSNMKTHDLEKLFGTIKSHDIDLAKQIENEYLREVDNPVLPSLDKFLTCSKNAFEEFRYMHERATNMKLYVSNLSALCRVLRRICRSEQFAGCNYTNKTEGDL